MTAARFPLRSGARVAGLIPTPAVVPLTFESGAVRIDVEGTLDSTALASVLPRSLGLRPGAVWSRQTVGFPVPSQPKGVQAIPLSIRGFVPPFPSVPLVFAWASTDDVPLTLGQTNFFLQYDVCFHLARTHVEVRPAGRQVP